MAKLTLGPRFSPARFQIQEGVVPSRGNHSATRAGGAPRALVWSTVVPESNRNFESASDAGLSLPPKHRDVEGSTIMEGRNSAGLGPEEEA